MKAAEQYFPVVLFIMLYKVVLTFESVDEILKCDHSNESYWVVLSYGTVYYAVQGGSNFSVWILKCDQSKWNETYWVVLSCSAVHFSIFRKWELERKFGKLVWKKKKKKRIESVLSSMRTRHFKMFHALCSYSYCSFINQVSFWKCFVKLENTTLSIKHQSTCKVLLKCHCSFIKNFTFF